MSIFISILSVLAIIISVISLLISNRAVRIEKKRDSVELEKGKTALFILTSRYFLINLQRAVITDSSFTVIQDSKFTANYVEELEQIATLFDNLMTSSYLTVLFKNYAIIGVMPVFIRKEIMFIKSFISDGRPYGFDNVVWEKMFSTLEILRREVKFENNKWNLIIENEIYQNAKKINEFLKTNPA